MAWTPRTTAVAYGTTPYVWNVSSVYQCTWYAYYRVQEEGLSPPCWWDRETQTGTYTNAKYWLVEYRNPWIPYDTTYIPVVGDIIVFTGVAGHVAVVERKNANGTYDLSDYNGTNTEDFGYYTGYSFPNTLSFSNHPGYSGTGACIGFLHNPNSSPIPPTPPTPSVTPTIEITPSSYTSTMGSDEDFLDFSFLIRISGIPYGESASGGNTYPNLSRVQNTGWSYTTYTVSGVRYQEAVKQQTLRYDRVSLFAYTTIEHMYYNLTFSNGSINTDTRMNINVLSRTASQISIPVLWKFLNKRKRKQGIKKYERL